MSTQSSSEKKGVHVTPWRTAALYSISDAPPPPQFMPSIAWHVMQGRRHFLEFACLLTTTKACVELNTEAGAVHGDVTPSKMAYRQFGGDKVIGVLIDYDVCVRDDQLENGEQPATGGITA